MKKRDLSLEVFRQGASLEGGCGRLTFKLAVFRGDAVFAWVGESGSESEESDWLKKSRLSLSLSSSSAIAARSIRSYILCLLPVSYLVAAFVGHNDASLSIEHLLTMLSPIFPNSSPLLSQ